MDKNRDTLHATISTCLTRSEDPFVRVSGFLLSHSVPVLR